MAKQANVNYTAELVEAVVNMYSAGSTLEEIEAETGKSVRSLRAKLSSLGVYRSKKVVTSKSTGNTRYNLVRAIEERLGLEEFSLASFENAKKSELEALTRALGG